MQLLVYGPQPFVVDVVAAAGLPLVVMFAQHSVSQRSVPAGSVLRSRGCRAQLVEVVEEWVLGRVARGLPVPRLGKAQIRVRRAS